MSTFSSRARKKVSSALIMIDRSQYTKFYISVSFRICHSVFLGLSSSYPFTHKESVFSFINASNNALIVFLPCYDVRADHNAGKQFLRMQKILWGREVMERFKPRISF